MRSDHYTNKRTVVIFDEKMLLIVVENGRAVLYTVRDVHARHVMYIVRVVRGTAYVYTITDAISLSDIVVLLAVVVVVAAAVVVVVVVA